MTRLRLRTIFVPLLLCVAVVIPAAHAAAAHDAWREQASVQDVLARSDSGTKTRSQERTKFRTGHGKAIGHRGASRRRIGHKARSPRPPSRLRAPRKNATVVREADPSRAVTIAKVLATPCQNAGLVPEPADLQLVREAVLCLVNVKRAQNGETPLLANAELEQAAEGHGQEMIALNYFDHVSPSGLTPVGRIRTTGYVPAGEVGYVIGENLAWGTYSLATPQAIVNAWIASPGHLANILESRYRDTGIAVVPAVPTALAEGAPGATYIQEFGVIVR